MRSEPERFNDFQNQPPCHNPSDEAYVTCRMSTISSYVRNVERYAPKDLNFYGGGRGHGVEGCLTVVLINYIISKYALPIWSKRNYIFSHRTIIFNLRTAAFKAYCAIWVRRSNFRHQASPRVSPGESTQRRKVGLWARNVRKFCLNVDLNVTFRDLLHAVKLRHGTDGFTSPPKEGVLRIFRAKNPTALAGCEPANFGTKGQHATSRPPKPLIQETYFWPYAVMERRRERIFFGE
jgi:hypothetical protein